MTKIKTNKGREIESDLQIPATGLTPNTKPLALLSSKIVSPSGFVPVLPTSQVSDPAFPNIFCTGDVTEGIAKTAKEARRQSQTAVDNIVLLANAKVQGRPTPREDEFVRSEKAPLGIHLVMAHSFDVFGRQDPATGVSGAMSKPYNKDKPENLGASRIWEMLGFGPQPGAPLKEKHGKEGKGKGLPLDGPSPAHV
ncbi:hypothetical protein HDU93_001342 [Gonapodya sp. JEL0774]|nr:hypothetical protein HDU93_001342 [Gonapodya sp. JEL0774]